MSIKYESVCSHNVMDGRKDKLGGEARSKEEAGDQKGKKLIRNRKSAGRSRAERVALPDPEPTAPCRRDEQLSSLGTDILSYMC